MAKRHNPPQKRSKKRGGKLIPALCNVLGTLFLLLVIVLLLPLGLPKLMGYQVYNVVSGSMEPTIPVGSMILVKPMEGSEIEEKDIILFHTSEETVVTHRVMENHVVEGEFITKGDANDAEDLTTVPYANLVGKVTRHISKMGDIMTHITSPLGRVYLFGIALCGLLFNILAGRLRLEKNED